jgi:hypothetical protein
VGYFYALPLARQGGVQVLESVFANQAVGLAILRRLKAEGADEIRLGWPTQSPLVCLGRSLGSALSMPYQWLLRLPDIPALLTKLAPVLERRVAASPFRELTTDLCLNLFREAFVLHFREGQLRAVTRAGFVDFSMGAEGGDANLPPDAFVRLLFGYRTLDELDDAWPDIVVRPASRYLLEVLFSPMTSYFWMPYMVVG